MTNVQRGTLGCPQNHSGPEGRAEAERTAERSGDHSPAPDATEGQAETFSKELK